MEQVYRCYAEKRTGFDVEAEKVWRELKEQLGIANLEGVRIICRYDVDQVDKEVYEMAKTTVFSEPMVDDFYDETMPPIQGPHALLIVEALPGQFDQRVAGCDRPLVKAATVYVLLGDLSDEDCEKISRYLINPVEAREATAEKPKTLVQTYDIPTEVATLDGFIGKNQDELKEMLSTYGLAMDLDDLTFLQAYFRDTEHRDPTITELRVVDTYWSDHCRHTTFGTHIEGVQVEDPQVQAAYDQYLAERVEVYGQEKADQRPKTLMDIGTSGTKVIKKRGGVKNIDESEEINACSIHIPVAVDGQEEDWLLQFKNETHNHPTEIEPFGGAATCVGGAIRDPLAGRAYVYQAMRITGCGDPRTPMSETIKGRLPQRKLATTAAAGYSSYGNQIGLATGVVQEYYHPGYVAKHMELGAVVGAVPSAAVVREEPAPGDIVILLGGRTGRDGIGGATGSSKAHKLTSLETCGAEVQKGNAPIERKLQRLFRREDACCMIKRCNDFGAGGVSVAIGELADGLNIDLNKVTKKYEGLDGTELAISESQERMAVAVAAEDAEKFIALANEENLEATVVATVTEEKRMRENWNGVAIVDLSREFLNSNGAERHADVHVLPGTVWQPQWAGSTFAEKLENLVGDLNVCSQKGLGERFDSTIGASTVLMPYGGKYQLTPTMAMAAKLPVDGETTTCSGMAWGFNPYLTEADPYRGAYMAVVESVTKLVCAGFRHKDMYLTFQEYFEHLNTAPERWGKPLAALLGALDAQMGLGIASIGGKDSMSGSFEGLDVPPTLVSFATAIGNTANVMSPEFKKANSSVVILKPQYKDGMPEIGSLLSIYKIVEQMIDEGKVLAAATPGYGGVAEALFKMCVGNHVGLSLSRDINLDDLFKPCYGAVILELLDASAGEFLGSTTVDYAINVNGENIDLQHLQDVWEAKLQPVFPYLKAGEEVKSLEYKVNCFQRVAPAVRLATPRVIIPVFPGTNCEYDTARAFRRAGGDPHILVLKNLTPADVAASCEALVKELDQSQILMLPGGFSGGDEPDGSAKFIAAFFRNPAVADAVNRLLNQRDGLALGICNGFQALIKLGLVPYGEIRPITENDPTLTFNTIHRHQSMLVRTRVASNKSPWLSECNVDDEHLIAISHGEGRFVCNDGLLQQLINNGQVATQYVDLNCVPTMDMRYNPNGSVLAIEGITSPDGRVFGKMGHSERSGDSLYKNVTGDKYQPIFEGGVNYFKL